MAVDNKHNALSVDQIMTITREVEPDILESASLVNDSVFEDMKINVIRDLENVNALMVFDRKVGTTRRYQANKPLNNKIGFMHERELKVALSWNRFTENIQNFREKAPFSILGSNDTYAFSSTQTAFMLAQMAKIYSQDVLSNLFFGKESKGVEDAFGLYDGYFAHIERDINAGRISVQNGNYQELDPIDGSDPVADYETAVKFYQGLDLKLKMNPEILIYCSETTFNRIVEGYLQKYQGLQSVDVKNPSFKFMHMERARFVAHPALGEGDCLIASVPYNLDFGSDMTGAVSQPGIKIANDQNDFNVLIFQMQTAQGTRIREIASHKFCVSNGKNTPFAAMGGEYVENTLTVGSNDKSMGSVSVSPEQATYEEGDKVTLTATAAEGYEFVKWSDNATVSPRTIVFGGFPETYQAIFQKKADAVVEGGEDEGTDEGTDEGQG